MNTYIHYVAAYTSIRLKYNSELRITFVIHFNYMKCQCETIGQT